VGYRNYYLEHKKVDELDIKIIKAIRFDGRAKITDIAKKLGQNPIVIRNRIKRMEEKGVITYYTFSRSLKKLGITPYTIVLTLKSRKPMKKLHEYCKQNPFITATMKFVGFGDLWFTVYAPNISILNEIIDQIKGFAGEDLAEIEYYYVLKELVWVRVPEIIRANK